jgi:uncharacterized protein (TIGR00251 family)
MTKTWLKIHSKGSILFLYIQPGAARTEIYGLYGDRLKIRIKAHPQNGEANDELIEFLGEYFGISKLQIFLIRGEGSRQKDLLIELSPEELISLRTDLP